MKLPRSRHQSLPADFPKSTPFHQPEAVAVHLPEAAVVHESQGAAKATKNPKGKSAHQQEEVIDEESKLARPEGKSA